MKKERIPSKLPHYIQDLFLKTWKLWEDSLEEDIFKIKFDFNFDFGLDNQMDTKLLEVLKKSFDALKENSDFDFGLEKLERIFPIPLLFIAPRKHSIVIYSIYRNAIGKKNKSVNEMANYEEFASYLFKSPSTRTDFNHFYIFYYNQLKLIKLVTSFRKICGLETGKTHYRNKKLISDDLVEKIIPLFCLPSNITFCIQKLMNNSGFEIALAFVYKITRVSESIEKLTKTDDLNNDIIMKIESKIKSLLSWYEEYFIEKKIDSKNLVILSKAHMSEKNICIAGIFKKGLWGRLLYTNEKLPISILKDKKVHYHNFDTLSIPIMHQRSNAPHIEDYIINWNKPPKVIGEIPLNIREQFLNENTENSIMLQESQKKNINKIGELLEEMDRSLTLIGPVTIEMVLFKRGIIKKFQARIKYSIPNSLIRYEGSISCTDILWRKFGNLILSSYFLQNIIFSDEDLKNIFDIKKIFLVIGLSRKYRGKYWELIVGIHTVPDLSSIIRQLSHPETNAALTKFLKLHEEDFPSLYSNITLNIGQRNLLYSTKKKIFEILKDFDEQPTESLFKLIDFYENLLRDYIRDKMLEQTPKQWYRKHIEILFDQSKVGRINSKFDKDETKSCQYIYDHPNPLIYTSLEDLYDIITYPGYLQKYFKEITNITLNYMKEIENYRNAIYHSRPIKNEEDAIFYVIKVLEMLQYAKSF